MVNAHLLYDQIAVVISTDMVRWNAMRQLVLLIAASGVCFILFGSFWSLRIEISKLSKKFFISTQSTGPNPIVERTVHDPIEMQRDVDSKNSESNKSESTSGFGRNHQLNYLPTKTSSPRNPENGNLRSRELPAPSSHHSSSTLLHPSSRHVLSRKASMKQRQADARREKRKEDALKLKRKLTVLMWSLPLIWVAISIAIISSFVPLVQSEERYSEVIESEARGGYRFSSDLGIYITIVLGIYFQYYAHVPLHPWLQNHFSLFLNVLEMLCLHKLGETSKSLPKRRWKFFPQR
mmetsp:Transcript_43860/g.72856  ORF Transcript_43860/g.72856 Transcript_43860/m.72856 type:complete len:293 (+) Transcript_43860:2802-3680(+)